MKRISTLGTILIGVFIFMGVTGNEAFCATDVDNLVLRIQVDDPDDTSVKISVPLAIVQTIYDALPQEVKQEVEKAGIEPKAFLNELKVLAGKDFITITGEENVRIWITDEEKTDDLDFIRVHVKGKKDEGQEISVCVPVGLVKLAASTISIMVENGTIPAPDQEALKELQKALEKLNEVK